MKNTIEDKEVEAQAEAEDVTTEAENATGEASANEDSVDNTAQKLAETQEALAYLAADFENYKRQALRREQEARERAARNVLEQMLPALDNFNLALHYAGNSQDVASLKVGLEFVAQQLNTALSGAGLQHIEAVGKPFDPTQHEALEEVEGSDAAPGTVVEEVQKGYTYQGQVLRVSRVKVAR